MARTQRLLVSIRGPLEALACARGGAHIADVEYPASAPGTPYPLNVYAVRKKLNAHGFRRVMVSTNIGETPSVRPTSCQAALGVAVAGADLIKFGLAEQTPEAASYLGRNVTRTVRSLTSRKHGMYAALFVDDEMAHFLDPLQHSARIVVSTRADGILLDTFNKSAGKGLLDYCSIGDLRKFVVSMHRLEKEAWVAVSIQLDEMCRLCGLLVLM